MIWLFCYILAVREQRRRYLEALRDKLLEDAVDAILRRLREQQDAFFVQLERSMREQQEQLHEDFRQFLQEQFPTLRKLMDDSGSA